MDKIYSRKRFRIPKIVFNKFDNMNNKKNKKTMKIVIILVIAIITFISITRIINPIYNKLCEDKAKSIATLICNQESTKIIQNYKYEDLITIYKDENGNITMIKSNIVPINLIISDVAENIQKEMNKKEEEQISIDVGSLTGTKIFSGRGLKIPLKLNTVGNVETDFRSEFKSARNKPDST